MLIFVFLLGITDLFAQTLYVPGTIVKGKNASYYCSSENEIFIKVNNVNNVDTTTTMYYDDGTVVPHYVGLGGTIATKNEDLVRIHGQLKEEPRVFDDCHVRDDNLSRSVYPIITGVAAEIGGMWALHWRSPEPRDEACAMSVTITNVINVRAGGGF